MAVTLSDMTKVIARYSNIIFMPLFKFLVHKIFVFVVIVHVKISVL